MPIAEMSMPQVAVRVRPEVARKLDKVAAIRWPGQGKRAVDRMAREVVKRYVKETDGAK